MSKIVLCSDWHLTPTNSNKVKNLINSLPKEDYLFIAGDIFDARKAQPLESLNTFGDIIVSLSKKYSNIFAIPGNHDKVLYTSEESYLDEFKYHPKLNIFNQTSIVSGNKIGHPEIDYHFIPYFLEEGPYLDYLSPSLKYIEENPNKKHILITHIGIEGVINNDRNLVKSPVNKNLFKPFYKVFIGHYHDRQKVGDNIYYFGSLFTSNFGENNDKGYIILNSDGSHEYYNLDFQKYFTFTFNLNNLDERDKIEDYFVKYANHPDRVRFIFKGEQEELKRIDEKKFQAVGIKVEKKRPDIDKGITTAKNGEVISLNKDSIYKLFPEFCALNNLTEKQISLGEKYLKQQLENKYLKNGI